jgi:hypothetical protein
MGVEYGLYGEEEKCLQSLVGQPESKRQLRRSTHGCEDTYGFSFPRT